MNRYCYVLDRIVVSVEPEYVDIFPGIHITERYSKDFIDNCVIVDESIEVQPGMMYEDGVFKEVPPVEHVPPTDEDFERPPTQEELINALGQEMAVVKIQLMMLGGGI